MLFSTIATFATFALSAVSVFAAPTGETETSALAKKAQPQSLSQIFAGATQSLTPLTQQLRAYPTACYSHEVPLNVRRIQRVSVLTI